jgi:flagellar basal-body rod protein FlgB
MSLFDGTMEVLRLGVGLATRRHQLLAQNVAHAETPGYRARDLAFVHELSLAQQTRAAPAGPEAAALGARLVESPDPVARPDANTVDIDRQMTRVAGNTVYQHTLVQILNARFRAIRAAINGHA